MSVPSIDAWLDEDGLHVWQAHPCKNGEVLISMLPYPNWSADSTGHVTPSVHCLVCGAHQFPNTSADFKWNAEAIAPPQAREKHNG